MRARESDRETVPVSSVGFQGDNLADVQVLAGTLDIDNSPLAPYADCTLAFLADVSQRLLKGQTARQFPDIAAFAYWCRAAHLKELKGRFLASEYASGRLGRGLALHIAPANIPVNFAFSFVFAALAGNANIVRVPSRDFAQIELICAAVAESLKQYSEMARRLAFVRYPATAPATAEFSAHADARLLWGGDATIARIGALATPPRCVDIHFADRYSVALLDGAAITTARERDLQKLAQGFYNDTYLMDQNACSSPHMLFWLNASKSAQQRFWDAVRTEAAGLYRLQPQMVMDKYVQVCSDIIAEVGTVKVGFDSLLTVVDVSELPRDLCGLRGIGGYFYQATLTHLNQLAPLISDRYQSLLYYGLDPRFLQQWVIDHRLRGIDRIVELGKALDIDIIWDGYDLVTELSRIVDAR
jgi:hypothetical protein